MKHYYWKKNQNGFWTVTWSNEILEDKPPGSIWFVDRLVGLPCPRPEGIDNKTVERLSKMVRKRRRMQDRWLGLRYDVIQVLAKLGVHV